MDPLNTENVTRHTISTVYAAAKITIALNILSLLLFPLMNRLDRNCLFLEVNAAMIHTPNASLYSVFRYIMIA
jgi:hypothetical protein